MPLDPTLNFAPDNISSVHLMGIGGVAMGSISAVRAVLGPDCLARPRVNRVRASGRASASGRALLARARQ